MFNKEQIKRLKELLSQMGFSGEDIKSELKNLKSHLE